MSLLQSDARPVLQKGCRISVHPIQGAILLVPEGVIKLRGTAYEILGFCNGSMTYGDIVEKLVQLYPLKNREQLEVEVSNFLKRLFQKSIVSY